jgi:hypothetical protein
VIGRAALAVAIAAALALVAAAPAFAGPAEDFGAGAVVFARDASLWKTDPRGKGPAVELVKLPAVGANGAPAHAVRAIRADLAARTLIADIGGRWYWTRLEPGAAVPTTMTALPCGGAVRLLPDGNCVLCATEDGRAALYRLGSVAATVLDVPAPASLIVRPAPTATDPAAMSREVVWADGKGVWIAPVTRTSERRALAPEAPLRHFLTAPSGKRAVGVFRDTVTSRGKELVRDQLFGFALDGKAARRKVIRDGVPVDWSWDSQWLLVQNGGSACVMRAVGGEYKCWKGFTAVSIAPDGTWALLLGKRSGGDDRPAPERRDDADEDSEPAGSTEPTVESSEPVPLPSGPSSLYRARLAGAYSDRPALVERIVDGAALWLAPFTPTGPAIAPTPKAAPSAPDAAAPVL